MASSIFYSQNLAPDQYINWGITSGSNGYGIRDNAGTIEFKDTGGTWAPIASSSSGGGWQRVGTEVSLVTGTDTITSNLRPTDATYTLGDATHRWDSLRLSDTLRAGDADIDSQFTLPAYWEWYKTVTDLTTDPLFGTFDYYLLNPANNATKSFNSSSNEIDIKSGNTKDFSVDAFLIPVYNSLFHFGSGTIAEVDLNYTEVDVIGPGTITSAAHNWMKTVVDTGVITSVYGGYFKPPEVSNGGTITDLYAYWASDQAVAGVTNPYYLWFDSRGVYRVREDNVADGSGNPQAIPALYNPRFTKYTAGLANYERIIEQWVSNVATFGVESGGTGTNRDLNLIGAHIQHNGHVGISTTVTTASLVGKTITFVDGLVTAFA